MQFLRFVECKFVSSMIEILLILCIIRIRDLKVRFHKLCITVFDEKNRRSIVILFFNRETISIFIKANDIYDIVRNMHIIVSILFSNHLLSSVYYIHPVIFG